MLEGGFGFAQFFFARNQQCVHDRIAETIVVDERPSATQLMNEGMEPKMLELPAREVALERLPEGIG